MDGIDMDISPNTYQCLSQVLQSYSEDIIREVKKNNKNYDYAIDLGSGLGNVTQIMYKCLNIKTIYGIDIDQNMVEFARRQTSDNSIRYVTENVSNDWHKLSQEIKDLEGKVGLVFTSFVIHFIADKITAAKNVHRLLAPGGEFNAVVVCLNDKINSQTTGICVPTARQQLDIWLDALTLAGFKTEQAYFSEVKETLPEQEFVNTFASVVPLSYATFMTEQNEEKHQEIISKVKQNMIDGAIKYTDQLTGTKMVRFEHEIYIFKVIKI